MASKCGLPSLVCWRELTTRVSPYERVPFTTDKIDAMIRLKERVDERGSRTGGEQQQGT
jgi:hypothetical protein